MQTYVINLLKLWEKVTAGSRSVIPQRVVEPRFNCFNQNGYNATVAALYRSVASTMSNSEYIWTALMCSAKIDRTAGVMRATASLARKWLMDC